MRRTDKASTTGDHVPTAQEHEVLRFSSWISSLFLSSALVAVLVSSA